MAKYYIRDTEFEFNTIADARQKAKELALTASEDVVICLTDTDAVKDICKGKMSDNKIQDTVDNSNASFASEDVGAENVENAKKDEKKIKNVKDDKMFYVELVDKDSHAMSHLANNSCGGSTFNSYIEAYIAANAFIKRAGPRYSYSIREKSKI